MKTLSSIFKLFAVSAFAALLFSQCTPKKESLSQVNEISTKRQDSIIKKYLTNCAENYNYTIQMK